MDIANASNPNSTLATLNVSPSVSNMSTTFGNLQPGTEYVISVKSIINQVPSKEASVTAKTGNHFNKPVSIPSLCSCNSVLIPMFKNGR